MPKGLSSLTVLDQLEEHVPLVLEILSFSGGENTIASDQELEANEARIIKNWDVTSLGGMKRSEGFTITATAAAPYASAIDLVAQHFEGVNTETYAIDEGVLFIKAGSALTLEDAAAFTSGILSHAVSAANALWITNSTDNLKRKTIGNALAAPSGVPPEAKERIYEHNFRLITEGGSKNVYGSRAGVGFWVASDAWSATNDAWSMAMPDYTRGCVPGFPSGRDLTVFTGFNTYIISNQPSVVRQVITNGIGCGAPYSIAKGNEGVFLLSTYPTLGIWLWDSVNYTNLTEKHNFINSVNLNSRIFGVYKDRKYFFIYNEIGSGVTYPNRMKIYDTRFGRWMERPVNPSCGDNLGYPSLQTRDSNELFIGSSRLPKIYNFKDGSTSDNGFDTQANYVTKVFTSRDFSGETGGKFPIDNVRIKLIKAIITYYGIDGTFTLGWSADQGKRSGSQTFDLTSLSGDLINTTFTVNVSQISSLPPTMTTFRSFNNSAVGRGFSFQILNNGRTIQPEIKKIKIHAVCLEEL